MTVVFRIGVATISGIGHIGIIPVYHIRNYLAQVVRIKQFQKKTVNIPLSVGIGFLVVGSLLLLIPRKQ